jgi:DNA-binding transcriptional regulator YiaG
MNNSNDVQSSDATKLGGSFTLPGASMTVHRMGYGAMQLAGRTRTARELERTEKEMGRLKGRLEELRRSFFDITSNNGKSQRPEAIREFCREINITMDTFTRLVGASRRTVAAWLAGNPPNPAFEAPKLQNRNARASERT